MAYRKRKFNQNTGKQQTGTVLDVIESSEQTTMRLKLEDGTRVRLNVLIEEIIKWDELDKNGNAVYDLTANLALTFVDPKDILDD